MYYDKTAHHSVTAHKVYLNADKDMNNLRGAGTTWFHEHGHYIDCENNYISQSKTFLKCIKNDVKAYEKAFRKSHNLSIKSSIDGIADELNQNHYLSHSIQDIFGGVHKRRYSKGLFGHTTKYWLKHGKYGICRETFAHMFEAMFEPDKQKLMMHYLPTAWEEFQKILGGLL